jgi:hypothetical protein
MLEHTGAYDLSRTSPAVLGQRKDESKRATSTLKSYTFDLADSVRRPSPVGNIPVLLLIIHNVVFMIRNFFLPVTTITITVTIMIFKLLTWSNRRKVFSFCCVSYHVRHKYFHKEALPAVTSCETETRSLLPWQRARNEIVAASPTDSVSIA